ncbi:MAG: glycosyltransferase N-terminal domain-containing protein [Hyphomicrobiaceae bacterium]
MARLPVKKTRLSRMCGRSIARYVDFVHRTSRLATEPTDVAAFLAVHQPAIIAVWHGQFLLAPKVKPLDVPLAIMLARHGDAELFANALARFNTTLIRGAGAGVRRKDRGGAYALRAALRTLEEGVFVGMTADVPPGPARRAGAGIVTLAKLSGRPIIPLAVASSRYHAFRTWSRMTLNLPFGTLGGVFGTPIHVPRDASPEEMELARQAVENGLDEATTRAYQLAGSDPARATPPAQPDVQADSAPDTSSITSSPGLGLATYKAATRLMQPAASLMIGYRMRKGKEDEARRKERMGIAGLSRPPGRLVWIHAASVGEFNAALPLSQALRQARPDLRLLFTTGTVTSAQLAAERIGDGNIHQYVPLDAPQFVRRFLDHWKPDLAVFTESEIWPNLVLETARRAIPMALVNARMSNRSFERWRRLRSVARPLVASFDVVLAQNEQIARRFCAIGATRALAVGNLKIDAPPPPVEPEAFAQLKDALGGRRLLVAASTHEGEERVIAEAYRAVTRGHQDVCALIAPRHPERGTEIAELMRSLGFRVAQRSTGGLPHEGTEIYIADTIGELGTFYAAALAAFIGGSLVNHGGQNPIEAIRHGAAVISGPHWHNFRDSYDMLLRSQAVLMVRDAEELAGGFNLLLDDNTELQAMRLRGQVALSKLAGALEHTVTELLKYIPDEKDLRRAG